MPSMAVTVVHVSQPCVPMAHPQTPPACDHPPPLSQEWIEKMRISRMFLRISAVEKTFRKFKFKVEGRIACEHPPPRHEVTPAVFIVFSAQFLVL